MINIYKQPELNMPIESLNGVSIRKAANVIYNSLMLVEEPEGINYNITARLYRLFTQNLDSKQKGWLNWLLSKEYASKDAKLKRRLGRLKQLSKFRMLKKGIETEADLAADIMANIMYNTARANTNYAKTLKEGSAHLYLLVDKYSAMQPELKEKSINLQTVLDRQLNTLDAAYGTIYKSKVEEFTREHTKKKIAEDGVEAKVLAKGDDGEETVIASVPKSIEDSDEEKLKFFGSLEKRGMESLETKAQKPVEKEKEWNDLIAGIKNPDLALDAGN